MNFFKSAIGAIGLASTRNSHLKMFSKFLIIPDILPKINKKVIVEEYNCR